MFGLLARSQLQSAILEGWRGRVSADLCVRKGFRGAPGWILMVHCSSLTLTTFGRDKALLRSILVGCVWNGFLLQKVKGQRVLCQFCGGTDSDGHLFWECLFPPLVEIREHPEFHGLLEMDKSSWPRCLLWHGWLPLLSGVNGDPLGLRALRRVLLIFLSALLGGTLLMR